MSSRRERENPPRRRERRPELQLKEEVPTSDKEVIEVEKSTRARSRRREMEGVVKERMPRALRESPFRSEVEKSPAESPRLRERHRRIKTGADTPPSERSHRERVDSARTGRSGKESSSSRTTENTLLEAAQSESSRSTSDRKLLESGDRLIKVEASKFQDFMGAAAALKIESLFANEDVDKKENYTPDLSDNFALNAIIMQATTDSEGFTILNAEKYLEQKKLLVKITNIFESLQNKLSLELKVKDATENILKFNCNEFQVDQAKSQLLLSESKLKNISKGINF
jgi:hypothetical protein